MVIDYIHEGRGNRPGVKMDAIGIVIHDTSNESAGSDALSHAKYLKSDAAADAPVSWHFTVDDEQIVKHLPLSEHGWHAGDGCGPGNLRHIGIEICMNTDGNRVLAEMRAAELVATLLLSYGWGIERVKQHYDISGKNCPSVLRGRKNGWTGFLSMVEVYLNSMKQAQKIEQIKDALK